MLFRFALSVVLWLCLTAASPVAPSLAEKYISTPTGYLLVLRRGDDVTAALEELARQEEIRGATISGIGYLAQAKLGWWDAEKQAYVPQTFEHVELADLQGSIAWKEGEPSIHTHGVVGDSQHKAHAGHFLEMIVGAGSAEITITLHKARLTRESDPAINADVLAW